MAKKKNKISMPNSGAGLTSYFDGDASSVRMSPKTAAFIVLGLVIVIAFIQSTL